MKDHVQKFEILSYFEKAKKFKKLQTFFITQKNRTSENYLEKEQCFKILNIFNFCLFMENINKIKKKRKKAKNDMKRKNNENQ